MKMHFELTDEEVQDLQECLTYGIQRVKDAPDTPQQVRQDKLTRLANIRTKLARREM
jgi:hypothetical protein